MTRPLRRAHVWTWLVLTPLMVVVVVAATMVRKTAPTQAQPVIVPVTEPSR